MAISPTESTVRFGLFELDLKTRQLSRNGARIRLPQQAVQILSMLIERPGEVVTREELRRLLWPSDVFVDFDHGLNKSIQKLRDALGDSAASPRYIETIPRVGYCFIAPVSGVKGVLEFPSDAAPLQPHIVPPPPSHPQIVEVVEARRPRWFPLAASVAAILICIVLVFAGRSVYQRRHRPQRVRYTQLTDFTDSAVAPALSPDGRMVAFIRGGEPFLSNDQIYAKILPDGEAQRVTDDDRSKYGLAFSPDGTQIAYTVLDHSGFSTYEVSALGGEPHLLLQNAAGLVWLDPQHLLFSEIQSGIHMGVVTATVTRSDLRKIYFPAHQRGMAHASFPSPDRRWALVVEMNGNGDWAPCRLVGLQGQGSSRLVGPAGACTAAGWSPDGDWMYFTAYVEGHSHVWRQSFSGGTPEQLTFGPTEEEGIAVDPKGHALVTSVGVYQSALWIHDGRGDRQLSSEGEVAADLSPPEFAPDGRAIYYLLRTGENSDAELRHTELNSGKSETVFPGVSMIAFDLSRDGKQVVYATATPPGSTQLWLAPLDLSTPARSLGIPGARAPRFGVNGKIFFQHADGNRNYLEQVDMDGTHRSRLYPDPILEFQSVSPGRHWVMASVPKSQPVNAPQVVAIPLSGGPLRRICEEYCLPKWSADGTFLFVTVDEPSRTTAGRTLSIPVGPGERLPDLPPDGIHMLSEPSIVPGTQSIPIGEALPGASPEQYAWIKFTVHRNLYRISLP